MRTAGSVLLLVVLGACASLPQPEVFPPTATVPAGYVAPPPPGDLYRIDRARLTLYTYRSGWLSGLAHGHVMETDAVGGDIRLVESVSGSLARLYFRPWDLVLDEPAARAAAGPGFESERTPEDNQATRTRMLGPRGFDGNVYPFVSVEATPVSERVARLAIHLRETTAWVDVPVTWTVGEGRVDAAADFELTHRALGLRPYSAFAGAIAVAEPIRVRLVLSATLAPGL